VRFPALIPAFLFPVLLLPAVSQADRVISMPTGRKIPFGVVQLEYAGDVRNSGAFESYFGVGASPEIELEVRYRQMASGKRTAGVSVGYNLITQIPDLSPGITVGLQDVGNAGIDGRRVYLAFTNRMSVTAFDGDQYADLTFGIAVDDRVKPMLGFTLPLASSFRLLTEHDGRKLSAGVEIRPARTLCARYFVSGSDNFLSLGFTHRF
jgi:hypothetical protein